MKKLKTKKRKQKVVQDAPIVRYQTDREIGLSEEQVAERVEHGLVNDTKIKTSNSYFTIFVKNICTVFNIIWLFIAIALMCVNAWGDLMFLFVVIANTAISIFQEIKAKVTVEKLSMVTAPKIKVIRMGLETEVRGEDLLLDDIILLENGNQIPADCIIVEGNVEANESLLTGESNSIKKEIGSTLLAGSFLVSGMCYARVDKVGKANYIQTVAERTKDFKPQTSNLFKDLNNLIRIILIILIPIGILTFCKEFLMTGNPLDESIIKTSGSLTGMIPAGMYLLITVGLSVGVIKLARKKTLVKNLYSIEMLARANVLCLDKTGTITDGTMNVVHVSPQNGAKLANIEKIMKTVLASQRTMNATSVALSAKFGAEQSDQIKSVVEFSSQRKYSATTLKNGKTYFVGAIGFIRCNVTAGQRNEMNEYMEKGLRVVGLVESAGAYNEKTAGKNGKLLAIFALEDHIRKDAQETIAWFKENNVEIKIISGDDALTVSKIAKRVGVENSDKFVSLENMSLQEVAAIADKFTVFGRVTPEQKHVIVKTLKTQGKVVAMTGDGVNDTLALKEANCSIAMADGSEVARNVSHLVLMESNFSALPSIVKEGRQIVNNVQNSSVLYLMKTLFTIVLSVMTLMLRISYPFAPKQLLLLEMFVIGVPSFVLTFQPNSDIIRGNFIPQVLKKSIPSALLMFINIFIVMVLNDHTNTLLPSEYTSLSTMLLTFAGFINLAWLCWPLNPLRILCVTLSATLIVAGLASLGRFFAVTDFTFPVIITLVTLILCSALVVVGIYYLKSWYEKKYAKPDGQKPNLVKAVLKRLKFKRSKNANKDEQVQTEPLPEQSSQTTQLQPPKEQAAEKPKKSRQKKAETEIAEEEALPQQPTTSSTKKQAITNVKPKTSAKTKVAATAKFDDKSSKVVETKKVAAKPKTAATKAKLQPAKQKTSTQKTTKNKKSA